jgi:hypothetical protein
MLFLVPENEKHHLLVCASYVIDRFRLERIIILNVGENA